MSLERRFVNIMIIIFVALLLIGSLIVLSVSYSQTSDDSAVPVVKSARSYNLPPKVSLIPTQHNHQKADISNSVVIPKTKKPVIINL